MRYFKLMSVRIDDIQMIDKTKIRAQRGLLSSRMDDENREQIEKNSVRQ